MKRQFVTAASVSEPVDYNLHGLAGVRLLNATRADALAVSRQLGAIQSPLSGDPDIVIRFVDRLPLTGSLRYLGVSDSAFTDDAFLVLRSKHKSRVRVQIRFEQIGKHCEILCESGLNAVPLLIPILNLTVLGKGAVPLHASAFNFRGTGVLTTGWAKGGKTESLLAFMAKGAEYVGDEWVYLSGDGRRMYGIPEPIRVWHWQLQEMPVYRQRVARSDRLRLGTLKLLSQSIDWGTANPIASGLLPARIMRRLSPVVKRQLCVQLPPQRIFGRRASSFAGNVDKVFFVASHDSSQVTVQPMDPQEIARRMVFSLRQEQSEFLSYYWKYRFAFPERSNQLIEQAEEMQQERLLQVLSGKEAYAVYHPYPVSIPALFDAMSPHL